METRGESCVVLPSGKLPLSTYLSHDPKKLHGEQPVLLLKVLDPKSNKVSGDLYFEVHQEKREVYVVTHIDKSAWPSGVGGIRFGMSQSKRTEYKTDGDFKIAYIDAVAQYETLRRQIDEGDKINHAKQEQLLRERMDAFTHMRELRVGDVVQVPTWTPHALQHGVRVIEFQTPVYERYILSFAQQVITQNHWDTKQGVEHMSLDNPPVETFEDLGSGIERIARFDHFNVWRVRLSLGTPLTLPAHIPYAVCMGLTGAVTFGDLSFAAEEACFVPCAAIPNTVIRGDEAQLLIAAPNL